MMVQQALRHALTAGKKEILFQCGDANDLAQWGRHTFKEIKVTAQNYKKFMADYEVRREKFGPAGVQVGNVLAPSPENNSLYQYVLERGPGYYKTYETINPPNYLLNLIMFSYRRVSPETVLEDFDHETSKMMTLAEERIRKALVKSDYGKAVSLIDNLIYKITGTRPPRTARARKITLLQKEAQREPPDLILRIVDKFIEHWEYDKNCFTALSPRC